MKSNLFGGIASCPLGWNGGGYIKTQTQKPKSSASSSSPDTIQYTYSCYEQGENKNTYYLRGSVLESWAISSVWSLCFFTLSFNWKLTNEVPSLSYYSNISQDNNAESKKERKRQEFFHTFFFLLPLLIFWYESSFRFSNTIWLCLCVLYDLRSKTPHIKKKNYHPDLKQKATQSSIYITFWQ